MQVAEDTQVIDRLHAALSAPGLLAKVRTRGDSLVRRLTSQVRVSVMGLPGSGKTQLIEMLDSAALGVALTEVPMENMARAATETDIAIWCTQTFDAAEMAMWGNMPDALKDHGFLVLTQADRLAREGTLPARIAELSAIAADEFNGMFPVATLQYLAALKSDGAVSDKRLAASGASGLFAALRTHVKRGRQADLDGAELFLSRYGVAIEPAREPAPTPPPVPGPVAEMPEVAPAPTAYHEAPANSGDTEDVRVSIIAYLSSRNRELAGLSRADDPDLPETVLRHCSDTFDHLVELISDSDSSALTEEIEEAAEMVILMQIERSNEAAADAATLMLQLTRELQPAKAA